MHLNLALWPTAALLTLTACAVPSSPPETGVHLTIDGEAVRLFSPREVAAGGDPFAVYQLGQPQTLGTTPDGRPTLVVFASMRPAQWDSDFGLTVTWEAQGTADGALGSSLLAAPFEAAVYVKRPAGGAEVPFVGDGSALTLTLDQVAAVPEGVAVSGAFAGRACRRNAPDECVTVEGRLDLVAEDNRRSPGDPAPPPDIQF